MKSAVKNKKANQIRNEGGFSVMNKPLRPGYGLRYCGVAGCGKVFSFRSIQEEEIKIQRHIRQQHRGLVSRRSKPHTPGPVGAKLLRRPRKSREDSGL